ncbi:protein MODIFYING WALL LIGNIN-1-like [Nymphaea colorata]|nr:protein MODIFYING WALL LIGNIN-1-like [Nymphaea colorata]
MAVKSPSSAVLALISILHLVAFILIIAAERRRSVGKVVPDEYDEQTYCLYSSDVATAYAIAALFLVSISQAIVMGITRCLCCGRGHSPEPRRTSSVIYFIFSWVNFAVLASCLVAGAARNAYHTKYRGTFGAGDFSCETLRKGVFIAAAVLTAVNSLWAVFYYRSYLRSEPALGWKPYRSETDAGAVGMSSYAPA